MAYFPIYRQHDAMDCGPTCLKMIARFYGKYYSLETLREISKISREGVSIRGITEAAQKLGFETFTGFLSFEKLKNLAPLPCIIHWNNDHFVVVYKIKETCFLYKKTRVYIADPGKGKMIYSLSQFLSFWENHQSEKNNEGIVLLLEPQPIFYKKEDEGREENSLKFLWSYFSRYKKYWLQLLLGLGLGCLLQLIYPFLTQSIVDVGIGNRDIDIIWLILLGQVMVFAGRMTIDFIRRWIFLHISLRINLSLLSDFFIKLMKLPMRFFDTKLLGDLLLRIDDHKRLEQFLTTQSLSLVFSVFTLLIYAVILYIYSFPIFILFFVGSFVYLLWILFFLKKRRIIDYQLFELRAKNQSFIFQLLNGMQEIKLQHCENRKRWQWEDIQADVFKVNMSALTIQQYQDAGNVLINETKNIFITVIAAMSVINGNMTLGMMLAIQYIIGQLSSPVEQTANFMRNLQDMRIGLTRINEIHHLPNEDSDFEKEGHLPEVIDKDLVLKNLSFQYPGTSREVLSNVNITIPAGKITAIVGESGSGKTTLIKLLLKYYIPTAGSILVNNTDLMFFSPSWWRSRCGAVMQDGYIFSESIGKNISISDEVINMKRLEIAAKCANIYEMIMNMPLKFNTVIGAEGQGLSQGQKQRILIARAVYKNPDILFFDEATNSLDAKNEKDITENLEKFYKNKTVVIVAHRLSTVRNANQILVLDKGKIIEAGTHEELTGRRGKYFELVKNQLELGN